MNAVGVPSTNAWGNLQIDARGFMTQKPHDIASRSFRICLVNYPERGCISKLSVASGASAPWVREPIPPHPIGVESFLFTSDLKGERVRLLKAFSPLSASIPKNHIYTTNTLDVFLLCGIRCGGGVFCVGGGLELGSGVQISKLAFGLDPGLWALLGPILKLERPTPDCANSSAFEGGPGND